MQIKRGQLIIALAIAFIIANILFSLKAKPAAIPAVNNDTNSLSNMQSMKEDNALASAAAGSSSAGITVFGAKKVNNESVAEKTSEEIIALERAKVAEAAAKKASASSVPPNAAQEELAPTPAGVTISGKQPSRKQREEMNAKGIVLY